MNRSDRTERVAVTILGLLLLALGLYVLLRGAGTLGNASSEQPLLRDARRRFLGDHEAWCWVAGAAAAAISFVLGLHVLRRELGKIARAPRTPLTRRGDLGTTYAASSPLTDALEDELEGLPEIDHARAVLSGARARPRLDVRLGVADDADLATVRGSIEDHALERFRRAIEADELSAHVQLRLHPRNQRVV